MGDRAEKKHIAAIRRRRLALVLALILAIPIFAYGAFRAYYWRFYRHARQEFEIPGLAENFVPQGVDYCGDGAFLLSGYISTTGSSRIYYINADRGARSIRVCNEDGQTLTSHSGGICTNGPFTYLAGGKGKCYVLSSADLYDPTSEEANILGTIETDNAASFCYLEGDDLLVGEYEYGRRFKTPDTHHLSTPAGDKNTAVILAYSLDGDQPFGVEPLPRAAWSIPSRIQGMSYTDDGRIVLSASSFKDSSQLYFYDQEQVDALRGIYWAGDRAIPLYYLDSDCCTDALPLPPYAEETTFADGRLYVIFESASNRFQFGKFVGGQYVYSLTLPLWEKKG